jgi:hypothetical protein
MARFYNSALVVVLIWIVVASFAEADTTNQQLKPCDTSVFLDASANVWNDYRLHRNNIYQRIVLSAAENFTDPAEKQKATRIAETGSFAWM